MPGADPFQAIEELRARHPDTRVVVLSAYVRDRYIDMAVDRGAWGYFSKSDAPDTVIAGIRSVAGGQAAFGPEVRQRMESPRTAGPVPGSTAAASSRLADLSARELEVLRLIGRGMSRAEIAQHLHRSVKTIDAHHTSIMKKLDLHDRVELALFAVREGLVEGG
jgi:DNA-binding NarL/FixJ family response regulator